MVQRSTMCKVKGMERWELIQLVPVVQLREKTV